MNSWKKYNRVFFVLIVLYLTLNGQTGMSQTYFEDDFEYSDSILNYDWQFYPFGDEASTYTSSVRAHTDDRSLFMDSSDDDEQRIRFSFDQSLTNVNVEVYMYDDLQPYGWNHLSITDNSLGAHVGFSSEFGFGTNYSTEAGTLQSWEMTPIVRSEGWHKLAFKVTPEGLKYYIDDELVRTSDHITEIYTIHLECGNHGYGTAIGTVFFDDIKVYDNELIPVELSSFASQVTTDGVTLSWTTATETENLGFHIYRSIIEQNDYSQITRELIKGQGTSDRAHCYSYIDLNVESDNTYYYKLADIDFNGNMNFHGPISVTVNAHPIEYSVSQNYPNPFNSSTAINFSLKEKGTVTLKIYNLHGQSIRTIVNGEKSAGDYSVIWDGIDESGNKVASNVYLYTLQINDFKQTKKLILLK